MPDTTNLLTLEMPIMPLLTQRRSPRAWADQPVPAEELRRLFAAATSAASCGNEQPWRYLVADKTRQPEAYAKITAALDPGNQTWTQAAPVLAVSVAKLTFSKGDKPNDWARHDVGQATATMAIQAVDLGLQIHQMAGFSAEKLREAFQIPAGFEPVAVFTIGYPAPAELVPEELKAREMAPRVRKPLAEILFEGAWPA